MSSRPLPTGCLVYPNVATRYAAFIFYFWEINLSYTNTQIS